MGKIVGKVYDRPKEIVKNYAQREEPLLFLGETGSGKELFADLYIEKFKEPKCRSIKISCAEIPEGLLRSELFGHKKGAFTGAVGDRKGLIGQYNKGIIFLDELGKAPLDFQATLLRVMESGEYRPVGGDKIEECNTRIIAATNALHPIIPDLQHRFIIIPIPPLLHCDIPAILKHYLKDEVNKQLLNEVSTREYPGNVRELIRFATRLLVELPLYKSRSKTSPPLVDNIFVFDYERFRREFISWHKYIQPNIDKYKLSFRYKYFPDVDAELNTNAEKSSFSEGGKPAIDAHLEDILEVLEKINTVPQIHAERFVDLFKELFLNHKLPHLLKILDEKNYNTIQTYSKPDLSGLLNLSIDDGVKQFRETVVNYLLRECGGDKGAVAKRLKTSVSTINRIIRGCQVNCVTGIHTSTLSPNRMTN